MHRPSRRLAVALLAIALVFSGACASGSGPVTGATAYQLVSRAVNKTSAAKSARVSSLTRVTGPDEVNVTGSGVVDFVGRRGSMTMSAEAPSEGSLEFEIVFDGTVLYEKFPPELASELPGGKTWVKIDLGTLGEVAGVDLSQVIEGSPSDPTQALQLLLGASRNVSDLGTEKVRGVDTIHYRLSIDVNRVAEQAPEAARDSYRAVIEMLKTPVIPAEVWVDGQSLLRKMTFTETIASGPGAAEGEVTVQMTMEYYDFGVPVDIEVPPESEVVDILEIIEQGA